MIVEVTRSSLAKAAALVLTAAAASRRAAGKVVVAPWSPPTQAKACLTPRPRSLVREALAGAAAAESPKEEMEPVVVAEPRLVAPSLVDLVAVAGTDGVR